MNRIDGAACAVAAGVLLASSVAAGEIKAAPGADVRPAFDILSASVGREGGELVFAVEVAGTAGAEAPEPTGALAGAPVWSYVWPTSFDSAVIGFEPGAGTLAFAVTAHPDFDDTPLDDEDGDGDPANDGRNWHSHWVVLVPGEECGPGALKVKDIPEGETPPLPETWPNLPILIDSPGWHPAFEDGRLSVRVPFADTELVGVRFDGVTAALRVNADVHAPLLCVTDVFDVASGDLSMPGTVE